MPKYYRRGTPAQAAIARLHYLEGQTLDEIAAMSGLSSKQAVNEAEERALDRLARGNYRRELRECLDAFTDFRAARDAAKFDPYTGSRAVTAALRHIGKEGIIA